MLVTAGESVGRIIHTINARLDLITEWLTTFSLSLSKSKVMLFGGDTRTPVHWNLQVRQICEKVVKGIDIMRGLGSWSICTLPVVPLQSRYIDETGHGTAHGPKTVHKLHEIHRHNSAVGQSMSHPFGTSK